MVLIKKMEEILVNEKYEGFNKFKNMHELIESMYKNRTKLHELDPEEVFWLNESLKEKTVIVSNVKEEVDQVDNDPELQEDSTIDFSQECVLLATESTPKTKEEEYLEEYFKCKSSFEYFCSKYIKIEIPGEDKPFTWYEPQRKLAYHLLRENYIITLKSRQIGISTLVQAYIVWLFVFWNNLTAGIVSKDGPEATDFARKTRDMIDKLPDWLRPGFAKRTEQSFILDNGCKLYAVTVNPQAPDKTLRGKTITLLVIDEAAFCQKIDQAFVAIAPALSKAQQHASKQGIPYATIILSTPNKTTGKGKWYYDQWRKAVAGESIFYPVKCHWREVAELRNDPTWYQTQCALLDNNPLNIQQELELKFVTDEGAFLPSETIITLQENVAKVTFSKQKVEGGEFWEFLDYNPTRFHIVGVDTASGMGQDHSAIVMFDYETMEQVADYKGKLPVLQFGRLILKLMAKYKGLWIVENNSYGKTIVEMICETPQKHQLYSSTKSTTRRRSLFNKKGPPPPQVTYGLSTNTKTRPLIIESLFSFVVDFPETIKSPRLMLELIGLEEKNGKIEGSSDDLAMAAGFCYYVRYYDPPFRSHMSSEFVDDLANVINMNNDIQPNQFNMDEVMEEVRKTGSIVNIFKDFI